MKKSIQSTWAKNPVNQFATSKLCRAFYLLVILIMAIGMGQAATITWDGSSSTSWASAANWSSNSVPTASDDVIIPSGVPNFPFISTSVTVKSVEVKESSGFAILDKAARESVEDWKFLPGMRDGKPEEAFTDVTIRFELTDD